MAPGRFVGLGGRRDLQSKAGDPTPGPLLGSPRFGRWALGWGMAVVSVDREQVMAYRVGALGLAVRGSERPGDLALLDLGVQEYTPGSMQVALAARTDADLVDDRLIMVW